MRKIYFNFFVILLFSMALGSCKKELTYKVSGTSSLTIVNGVVGNSFYYTNFNGEQMEGFYFGLINTVHYGSAVYFSSYSGQQRLGLYQLPDTAANSKPVFSLKLDMPVNTTHTLFLAGTTTAPDQFFTTDQLPYHAAADSTIGFRFVNLSKGNAQIAVNLANGANGSAVPILPYKSVTAFKKYPAGAAINSYTFEFRDKDTGELLGSCTIGGINNDGSAATPNLRRYRNFTLALLGTPGGLAINRVLIIDEAVHQ